LAKRIHDIAKELGIKSKAIIDKCVAEGVPADKVKNHMATLSPGLEASIREWFAAPVGEAAPAATAVETTEHVDIDRVRAKPRKRAAIRRDAPPEADESGGGGVITTEPIAPRGAASENGTAGDAEPRARRDGGGAAVSEPPRRVSDGQTAPEPDGDDGVAPAQPAEPTRAAARAAETARPRTGPEGGAGPEAGPGAGPTGAPVRRGPAIKPAPMNVPTRPSVVSPAGRKLEIRTPVKLAGPKVVRIEAPEFVDRPKPRRAPGEGPPAGAPVRAGDDDDRSRSPRRGPGQNKRRPGGAGAGPRPGASPRPKAAEDTMGTGIFSEQDLLEREARLQRAGGFLKKRRHDLKSRPGAGGPAATPAQVGGKVKIVAPFTIKDLSATTGVKVSDIVKKLFLQGVMATANSGIEAERAQEIMLDFNIDLEITTEKTAEEVVSSKFTKRDAVDLRARGPIVTILGHVDHGKTSLLDKIRNANVAAGEAGGITQATSAFRVPLEIGGESKHIVFLDTPGHEAFTSMRARGAAITDIVVLVVSAPEGVAPQTIESISHARAAGVPIVVALNKIDRPDATEARVNQTLSQLADQGLNPVEWGGSTEVVRTSAVRGDGIPELLELLDLQGQMLELKADAAGAARGTVIEARLEEGRGPVANVIVQDGRLKVGDFVVVGRAYGRVRDIIDDRGQRLKEAGPGMPVQVSGLDELPDAGDKFFVADSLKEASEAAEQRRLRERQAQLAQPKVTLDSLFSQMKEGELKEMLIVLKADVQGSVDVIKSEIEKVSGAEVKVRVIHAAVGGITESDVLLAAASKAIIIGFNVIPSGKARTLAENKNVEIRSYQVIYEITDDVRKAAEGLLEPELRQEVLGHAEVRRVFKVSRVGAIAGCYVTDGVIERNAFIRVTRNGVVIENARVLEQLKRFKDDAKEVRMGNECGMKIVGYDDIKEGDVLECYKQVEVARKL